MNRILGVFPGRKNLLLLNNGSWWPSSRIAMTRMPFRNQTTATVTGRNDDDEIHRFRYRLYKFKICPFSNIAKVFLEYQKIPFEPVEVNPLTRAELGFSESYRKVSIVFFNDWCGTFFISSLTFWNFRTGPHSNHTGHWSDYSCRKSYRTTERDGGDITTRLSTLPERCNQY